MKVNSKHVVRLSIIVIFLGMMVFFSCDEKKNAPSLGDTLTISEAPNNPTSRWVSANSADSLVFGVELTLSQVHNLNLRHVMPWLLEAKDQYDDPGITSVSLFANTYGKDFEDDDTYLVATRNCDGARIPFTNVNIPLMPPSQQNLSIRLYFTINGFSDDFLEDGKEFTFYLGIHDIVIQKKKGITVKGSATSGTIKLDLFPPQVSFDPCIDTSSEKDVTLTGSVSDNSGVLTSITSSKGDFTFNSDTGKFTVDLTLEVLNNSSLSRNDVEVIAIDEAGLQGKDSASVFYKLSYIPNSVLVRFKSGTSQAIIDAINSEISASIVYCDPSLNFCQLLIPNSMQIPDALAHYSSYENVVEFAEYVLVRDAHFDANDPEYVNPNRSLSISPFNCDAKSAWNTTYIDPSTGMLRNAVGDDKIVVAVIDEGVAYDMEDLKNNIWLNTLELPSNLLALGVDRNSDGQVTIREINTAYNLAFPPDLIVFRSFDTDLDGSIEPIELFSQCINGVDDDGNGYTDDLLGFKFSIEPGNGTWMGGWSNDPYPAERFGEPQHGTLVSGIIGAEGNNNYAIAGINWQVRIMALNAFHIASYDSIGNPIMEATDGAIASAINYAINKNVKIINMSFGAMGKCNSVLEEAIVKAKKGGVLLVISAGNEGFNNDERDEDHWSYPASYSGMAIDGTLIDNIISVGASGGSNERTSFSNYGSSTVDLAAPGEAYIVGGEFVTSICWRRLPIGGGNFTPPFQDVVAFSGTSASAPHVSGAAALIYSMGQNANYKQVRNILMTTTTWSIGWQGNSRTEGILNIGNAVDLASKVIGSKIVTGAGAGGGPEVRLFNALGAEIKKFYATGEEFRGGMDVTSGDLDGDGISEIICGSGPGGSTVFIFDQNGNWIDGWNPYGDSNDDGIRVAVGDVNNDGVLEIVTGTRSGSGPEVKIWKSNGDFIKKIDVADSQYTGGIFVACGDVDGNPGCEIITGAASWLPIVRIFDFSGNEMGNFIAYAGWEGVDIDLAHIDSDNDGISEPFIIAGPRRSSFCDPIVSIWGNVLSDTNRYVYHSFYAYGHKFTGGVRVAAGDIDGDGEDDIITGAGPGASPNVRFWHIVHPAGQNPFHKKTGDFNAYGYSFDGGVDVSFMK